MKVTFRREVLCEVYATETHTAEENARRIAELLNNAAIPHEDAGAVLAMVDRLRRAFGWPEGRDSYAAVINEAISRLVLDGEAQATVAIDEGPIRTMSTKEKAT